MCIFLYFGYAPSAKTGSVRKQNPWECEKVDVSVTPSASGRLQLQKHQAATSACFSARGRGWKSHLVPVGRPRPGTEPGHSLARSMDFKQRPVVSRHLEAEESEFHCRERRAGWGLVHRALHGGPFPCPVWSLEPGNQRS